MDAATYFNTLDTSACSDKFKALLAFLTDFYARTRPGVWQSESATVLELYQSCKDSEDFYPLAKLVGHTGLEAISELARRGHHTAERLELLAGFQTSLRNYIHLIDTIEKNGAPLGEGALISLDASLLPDWYGTH